MDYANDLIGVLLQSLYLGQTEPLGPHSEAVLLILNARGESQFYDQVGFSLWQVAQHRLLARQIMLREKPSLEQVTWMDKLNLNMTSVHISWDIQKMSSLAETAKTLTDAVASSDANFAECLERIERLLRDMQTLLISIETWTKSLTKTSKPLLEPLDETTEGQWTSTVPIPLFKCPITLRYHDLWLAYMWNFHAASQIVLRESLVEITDNIARFQPGSHEAEEEMQRLHTEQRISIHALSSTIIRTFPQLLGFMHKDTQVPYSLPQGQVAGRFFSLFAMSVVRAARFTSDEHKQSATDIINWINASHGLR